jgi:hypothetical protein
MANNIDIKPEKKGTFKAACSRWGFNGVNSACIQNAKSSGSTAMKKKAVFAENARKWNHSKGNLNGSA